MSATEKLRQDIRNIVSEGALKGGKKKPQKKKKTAKTAKTVKPAKPDKTVKKSNKTKPYKSLIRQNKVPIGYRCNVNVVNGVAKQKCSTIYSNKSIQREIDEIDARFKQMMQNFARF